MKQAKQITELNQAIELSVSSKRIGEQDAGFKIEVDGQTWDCYTVSISHRDVLCYCEQGTATFLVDSYGDRNVAELFDWNRG